MADTFIAPGAPEKVPVLFDPSEQVRPGRRWMRRPIWIAASLAAVWLAGIAITFLIHHTRLQRKLTNRLESVFGRHVTVGNYDFSLWSGPTLVAESVTFSEDPRFGNEYFLRAESVKVRLHWQSLFRGHMDLGTVTLEQPSLNLVRNSHGDWNLAEWLPRPASAPVGGGIATGAKNPPAAGEHPYVRFDRILVDGGRINFKRGDEKIAFAFTDVTGSVEPDSPGRWRIDLEAVPTRAAVPLQQAGSIHLAGQVGGTSSRLRPAKFALSWQDASISDVLRLARGYDFGVRGDFALALNARTVEDDWVVEAETRLRALHRWDLSLRADNPDLNVLAKFTVHPQAAGFEVNGATLEAPHSSARANAHFAWAQSADALGDVQPRAEVKLTESQIDLGDALAWIRAFHSDVAPDVALAGFVSGTATVVTSPLRLTAATARIEGATLSSPRLRVPAHVSPLEFQYDQGAVTLAPAKLRFGDGPNDENSLAIDASTKSSAHEFPSYHLAGSIDQVRDVVAAASALGWNISRGWDFAGAAKCDLRWQTAEWPWMAQPSGTIDWGADGGAARDAHGAVAAGATPNAEPSEREGTLLTPFLNEPVTKIRVHLDWRPATRRIALASADAFGGHWNGTLDAREGAVGWKFALSADHLATTDVDRWLNPRWRQSLLDRMLPFLNSNSASVAEAENIRAAGHISIEQLTVAPVVAHRVQGDLRIEGRKLELTSASAELAGGSVNGSFQAQFEAVPEYRVKLNFGQVDVAALASASPQLAGQFSGVASGELALSAKGANRSDLSAAVECQGSAHVGAPILEKIDLDHSFRAGEFRDGASSFHDAVAEFDCIDGKIDFRKLEFTSPGARVEVSGSVDFSRGVDLRFALPAAPGVAYEFSGQLARPDLKKIAVAPKP